MSNPKLTISRYFDSLVRQIDIFTEETLERTSEHDLVRIAPKRTSGIDSSSAHNEDLNEDIDYESVQDLSKLYSTSIWSRLIHPSVSSEENLRDVKEPASFNVRSYLSQLREELIEELRLAQEEAFANYERINGGSERNRDFESVLFGNSYYFVLNIHEITSWSFWIRLVKLDFYLNRRERQILG